MSNTRLTVVVRKDLLLPEGLLAAQVTHIAMQFIQRHVKDSTGFNSTEEEWIVEPYISVLAVNCYEDLCTVGERAKDAELPVEMWIDTIPSPTFPDQAMKAKVGVSIGPADFDEIKLITSGLSLY